MSSFKKWIPIIGIVIFLFVLIAGCSRSGSLRPNQPPEITITSYGGSDSLNSNPEMFQQKIFWEAHDVDGVVKSYAYRVLDTNDNPVHTSGHFYIDDQGWVYHYKEGITVDENTPPPNTPGYGTIWTKDVYALINFPAHDAEGDSADVVSKFEVKCKDDRGAESNIASKIFNVNSRVPIVKFNKRTELDGQEIGQGLYMEFTIGDPNIGLVGKDVPDHFEIMLKKRSNITGEYLDETGYNQWYKIYKHNEIYSITLSKDSEPPLYPNTYNDIYKTYFDETIIVYKAYNLAGIASKPDSITVNVKTGFHPGSLVYDEKCYALGKYQYTLAPEKTEGLPHYQNTSGDIFYAANPFTNLNGDKIFIGSDDIKFYVNWGWHGEYSGDDPIGGTKDNKVKDEDSDKDYHSKIKAFLVRLDNKPLYLPYLSRENPDNIYTDENGVEWLYIPSSNYNFQNAILIKTTFEHGSGNLFGTHKFEVKALDIQNMADPTPAEYVFKIDRYIPPEERSGILVLDNDSDIGSFAGINPRYSDMLSDYSDITDVILTTKNNNYYTKYISITDYIKYKFIILHSENLRQPTEATKLKTMFQALQMYLDFGGNLMITGGYNIRYNDIQNLIDDGLGSIFSTYFGIDMQSDISEGDFPIDVYKDITDTPSFFNQLQFFVGATSAGEDYPSLDFDYDSAISINPPINSQYNPRDALGPVSYIRTPLPSATPLYYFKSILPGDGPHDPTQTQYEEFKNFVVGQKNITDKNKCYIFTFPLSYMDINQAKELMNKIVSEVMGQ